MDEDSALALLFVNLKGTKEKDYLATAKACRFLRQKYGSFRKVAERVGVSSEIIREFDSLLNLPEEVVEIVKNKEIRLDTGYRLSTMLKDSERQIEVARAVAGLSSHDARAVIEHARLNSDMSAMEVKEKVMSSKTIAQRLHAVILPLSEEAYSTLRTKASKLKKRPSELAKEIIEKWLEQ
jgi:hypothetical protein